MGAILNNEVRKLKIILYENSSDNRVVNKLITNEEEVLGCVLKQNTSVQRPSIILRLSGYNDVNDYTRFNYMYIPSFDRYYYITDITFLQGKNVQFDCKVDVLMSFQKSIYESTQYVERQEDISNCNLYIPDENFNFMANDQLEIGSFGREMIINNTNFILTTVG